MFSFKSSGSYIPQVGQKGDRALLLPDGAQHTLSLAAATSGEIPC
jgi:hypothetical protein